MKANRSWRRPPLAASAILAVSAIYVAGVAVWAIVLLVANLRGVPRLAAALLVGSLVVAVGAGKYLKRCAASDSMNAALLASPVQPRVPTPCLPPRQPSDDKWYPAAATRDRTGTRLGSAGRDRKVESLCVEVDNSMSAPASARHTLQSWFASVNCEVPDVDDAVLVVSELVTNVVFHTTSSSVVMTAAIDDHRLRIGVHDRDTRGPVVASGDVGDGRGLPIVDERCDCGVGNRRRSASVSGRKRCIEQQAKSTFSDRSRP